MPEILRSAWLYSIIQPSHKADIKKLYKEGSETQG